MGLIIQYSVQIALAYIFKNFLIFSLGCLVGTLFQFVFITIVFRNDHKNLINKFSKLEEQSKKTVMKYVFSSFAHNVGDVIVYSTDSIIISSMIGAISLAGYYRYLSIANALFAVSSLIFTSLTSVVGHSFEHNTKEKMLAFFKKFYYLLHVLFFFF